MKKQMSFRMYTGLVLVLGLFLSACTKDGQARPTAGSPATTSVPGQPGQPSAPGTPGAPSSGGGSSGPVTAGTGDVGGGNGYNGLVLESYRVDVTQLEAFKQVIAKKFQNPNDAESEKSTRLFLNYKTWYIAPVRFKPIDNDVLGLSFTEDHTQQLAVQTLGEIWINKDFFDKMTVEQQADLVLHEIMMSYYMFKFESGEKLCRKLIFSSNVDCAVFGKTGPFARPSEPLRKLNEKDYQNIRSATAWILNEPSPIDSDLQSRKLMSLDFDRRFFSGSTSGAKFDTSLDRPLKPGETLRLIQQGFEKGLFQSECDSNFGKGGTSIPCQFTSQLKFLDESKQYELVWTLKADRQYNGRIRLDESSYISSKMTVDNNGQRMEFDLVESIDQTLKHENIQPGQKYYQIFALVRKTTAYQNLGVELVGLTVVEKVYHGPQEIEYAGGIKSTCQSESFTLNNAGSANYLLVKSKNFSDVDVDYMLMYGLKDFTCDDLARANSTSNRRNP